MLAGALVGLVGGAVGGVAAWASLGSQTGTTSTAVTASASTVGALKLAFVHPGIAFNSADLKRLKANRNTAPWKAAYESLRTDSHSSLTYPEEGPFAQVGRTPDVNLYKYKNDMTAVYQLALMYSLTGKAAYGAKATGIMTDWCRTQTAWTGAEPYLTAADYVIRTVAGADILRGTYPGWTDADTALCKKHFATVYWPLWSLSTGDLGAGTHVRSANQGADQLQGAMAIAVFNDDRAKFNAVVNAYLTDPAGGIRNSLPNGQIGDTGRDQGHAFGELLHLAFVAEVAWKQGVDLYAAENNRLLAASEYFSKYNLGGSPAFIRSGTGYGLYSSIGGARWTPGAEGLELIRTAYVVRKGLKAPYTTKLLGQLNQTPQSMVYRRDADASKATKPTGVWSAPKTTAATATSLKSADIGRVGSTGSASYSGGTWTLKSSDQGQDKGYHYAYKTLTGDGTIVARVTGTGTAKGGSTGLMLRRSLDASAATPYTYLRLTGSGYAQAFWRPGGGVLSGNYINYQDVHAPYWLKLVRRGNYVYGYTSPDGTNWSPAQNVIFPGLSKTVYIGLATTSGDTSVPNTSTFDHVATGSASSSLAAAPSAPKATASGGKVTLSWRAVDEGVYYKVLRATRSGGPYKLAAARVSGNTYKDTKVTNGTKYYYVIRTASFGGLSNSSRATAATP
ncbi:alginate lyase family protein [Streptomyces sp. GbtcB7]|uniref:alginate lyase family protein n=1 Tax=Streptomyces sp. GbtcB7 TaxID=2824752 RepID=UPI001C2FF992|nr:alginate lyase family protein [Streptomyces sp. GbtcB7]